MADVQQIAGIGSTVGTAVVPINPAIGGAIIGISTLIGGGGGGPGSAQESGCNNSTQCFRKGEAALRARISEEDRIFSAPETSAILKGAGLKGNTFGGTFSRLKKPKKQRQILREVRAKKARFTPPETQPDFQVRPAVEPRQDFEPRGPQDSSTPIGRRDAPVVDTMGIFLIAAGIVIAALLTR